MLLGGGVNFAELPEYAQIEFQVIQADIFSVLVCIHYYLSNRIFRPKIRHMYRHRLNLPS